MQIIIPHKCSLHLLISFVPYFKMVTFTGGISVVYLMDTNSDRHNTRGLLQFSHFCRHLMFSEWTAGLTNQTPTTGLSKFNWERRNSRRYLMGLFGVFFPFTLFTMLKRCSQKHKINKNTESWKKRGTSEQQQELHAANTRLSSNT